MGSLAYRLVQSVRVHTKSIDVTKRGWNTPLAKQVHQGVDALGVVNVKVPKHAVVRHVGLRVPLVGSVHGGELDGVPNEKDRQVVKDKILNTLFGVELGSPAADITHGIAGALHAADGRDAGQDGRLLAYARKELGIGNVRDVFQNLKFSKGPCCLGVDASIVGGQYKSSLVQDMEVNLPLRDAFARKMSKNLDSLCICKRHQTTVSVSIAHLMHRAWVVAWLAVGEGAEARRVAGLVRVAGHSVQVIGHAADVGLIVGL